LCENTPLASKSLHQISDLKRWLVAASTNDSRFRRGDHGFDPKRTCRLGRHGSLAALGFLVERERNSGSYARAQLLTPLSRTLHSRFVDADHHVTAPNLESKNMKFIKKPVEVEAWQVQNDLGGCTNRLNDAIGNSVAIVTGTCSFRVRTQHGWSLAESGDWIIQGVEGELYPCKHDIFLAIYEQADDPARRYFRV
jgi:hypothetical protein